MKHSYLCKCYVNTMRTFCKCLYKDISYILIYLHCIHVKYVNYTKPLSNLV